MVGQVFLEFVEVVEVSYQRSQPQPSRRLRFVGRGCHRQPCAHASCGDNNSRQKVADAQLVASHFYDDHIRVQMRQEEVYSIHFKYCTKSSINNDHCRKTMPDPISPANEKLDDPLLDETHHFAAFRWRASI